jgi:hypothetical protein
MKHISAYLGSPQEIITEKFAWLPTFSSFSTKTIWLTKYIEMQIAWKLTINHDQKAGYYKLIYTKNEYLMYLLKKEKGSVSRDPLP